MTIKYYHRPNLIVVHVTEFDIQELVLLAQFVARGTSHEAYMRHMIWAHNKKPDGKFLRMRKYKEGQFVTKIANRVIDDLEEFKHLCDEGGESR